MKKEKVKNGLFALAAILVIFSIAYYLRTNKTENALEESATLESQNEVLEPENESQTKSPERPVSDISVKSNPEFDTMLEKGNKAFYAKDYTGAIKYYNDALKIQDADFIYARLHSVYSVQGNTVEAINAINKAISKNQLWTEHWVTKLVYMDEKTKTSFDELKKIYVDGLTKVDSRTKPNLVTTFARIAEKGGMKDEAIAAWQKAIELYPTNKAIYQAEIDRINSIK